MEVNTTDLENLTGRNRKTIQKALEREKIEPVRIKGRAKMYNSTEVLPVLYGQKGTSEQYQLEAERARLAFHQANKAALEEQARRGELLEAGEVGEVAAKFISETRARVLAIGAKTGPLVAVEMDPRKCTDIINETARLTLEAIANLGDVIGGMDGSETAAETDR